MIKALLLDIDNTLIDFDKCSKKAMQLSCEKFGIPFDDDFVRTFHSINDGLWLKIEKRELTREQLLKIRWNTIFNAMKIDFDGELFEKEGFLHYLAECAETTDGAVDILKYLKEKGYILCAASNAMYKQQLGRLTNANIIHYMDKLYFSEIIGFEKPDKGFFDYCLSDLGISDKSEVMIIGDSLTADILGGINAGIKTCWFNKKNSDFGTIRPDHTVNFLSDIKNFL